MWLSLLAALLKLFNVVADSAARSGVMDAGQAILVADVIQQSLKRIDAARQYRRDNPGGPGADIVRLDRKPKREA